MQKSITRRWLRINLQTMFLAVTVFCVIVSWQLGIVRDRRNELKSLRLDRTFQVVPAELWSQKNNASGDVAQISTLRRWLGDEAIQEIWYSWYQRPSDGELGRLQKLFPESEIFEIPTEPCHPGCFPTGTLVETPVGPRSIETIQPGDIVNVPDFNSEKDRTVAVQNVFVTTNHLWRVQTVTGNLVTTETQPLCVGENKVVQVGQLKPGDHVWRTQAGKVFPTMVIAVAKADRTAQVFNLILGDSEMFVANGFLARSKPPSRSR